LIAPYLTPSSITVADYKTYNGGTTISFVNDKVTNPSFEILFIETSGYFGDYEFVVIEDRASDQLQPSTEAIDFNWSFDRNYECVDLV